MIQTGETIKKRLETQTILKYSYGHNTFFNLLKKKIRRRGKNFIELVVYPDYLGYEMVLVVYTTWDMRWY